MGIFLSLSGIALREVVGGALQKVGLSGGDAVIDVLTERFTDHSQRLTKALQSANERSWKALEVALAGDSLWERCKTALASAEDRAFREQVRAFLDISPLAKSSAEDVQLFKKALKELRDVRSGGALKAGSLTPSELAREAGALARFNDPQALLDAEWRLVDQAAGELRERSPNLWKLLVARPKAGNRPSLLAVAMRYYFRREVESDQALFQGLAIEVVTDTNARVRGLEEQIQKLLERLQLQGREVRPSDSMSLRNEGERQLVKQLVTVYRSLPEEKRRQLPSLLSNLGKLELAAGDFGEAQQKFQTVANMVSDPKAQAEAHHNAYQAALQRQQWAEALASIRQAVALDPARFAPFPLDRSNPHAFWGLAALAWRFCATINSCETMSW